MSFIRSILYKDGETAKNNISVFTLQQYYKCLKQRSTAPKEVPLSIYTLHTFSNTENNSYWNSIQKLNLTSYRFVYAKQNNLDYNIFSLRFENIGKRPSKFIYNDYRRYQNNNLLKGFLFENEPTR